jgi:hypothetical protein
MGIINPRPAMRCREERNIKATLAKHAEIWKEIYEAGVPMGKASQIAFDIVNTSAKRKKIWRAR